MKYFKSGFLNAGCGGACNGDNGVNLECHYLGKFIDGPLNGRSTNACAKTYFTTNERKTVTLYLDSDDGIAAWLNGQMVKYLTTNERNTVTLYLDSDDGVAAWLIGQAEQSSDHIAEALFNVAAA